MGPSVGSARRARACESVFSGISRDENGRKRSEEAFTISTFTFFLESEIENYSAGNEYGVDITGTSITILSEWKQAGIDRESKL